MCIRDLDEVVSLHLHSLSPTLDKFTYRVVEGRQSKALQDIRDWGNPVTNSVRRGVPTEVGHGG